MNIFSFCIGAAVVCLYFKWKKQANPNNSDNKIKLSEISNDQALNKVIHLIDSGRNIFITGGAGTGKSYMLRQLKLHYKTSLNLTSTTGISAININGQTIHAWSGIGIDNNPNSLWNVLNRIISNPVLKKQILDCKMLAIDEISMLHKDTLEFLNLVLQKIRCNEQPMGGIQTIFIGDFFQLPPVVKDRKISIDDFCFSSETWKKLNLETILLKEVKRQNEIRYINVLNHIREGIVDEKDWEVILDRYNKMPLDIISDKTKLHLYSTNKEADGFNNMCFELIKSESITFESEDKIEYYNEKQQLICIETNPDKWGDFGNVFNEDFRVPRDLKLKIGCRVMLLKNIDVKSKLANGSCGTVTDIANDVIVIKFDKGPSAPVAKAEFESFRYRKKSFGVDKGDSFKQRIVRKQFPVRLAYGITIHKSQGMTFDELVVHLDKIFADGQCYVALSRTTSLEGLNPIGFKPNKIVVNKDVVNFYKKLDDASIINNSNNLNAEDNEREKLIKQAIEEGKILKIKYHSNSQYKNEETVRTVKPKRLAYGRDLNNEENESSYHLENNKLYMIAFCELRQQTRHFRVENIEDIEVL